MNLYYHIKILILFGLQATDFSGQSVSTNSHEPVSLDESITYGQLDNGLTYYIKHLPEAEKVNLRFHALAGSKHQDLDQFEMAHFVEHMAFKSSENFPNGIKNDIITRNSLNMTQMDIGGSTTGYNTIYRFDAPVDNQKALEYGLLWFKDIATGLHFKTEEIDTERGVLIQELKYRTADNIQMAISENEIRDQLVPCSQNYSNFIEHHKTFDPERLKQFYKDWYRPDLMAIVVVGKIDDVDALEREIRDRFSEIKPKEHPREIPDCEVLFFNQPPQFIMIEKSEESVNGSDIVKIDLLFRDRKTLELTSSKQGIKRMNKIGLFINILNSRLFEKSMVYNSIFDVNVRHTHGFGFAAPSSFKAHITVRNNREKEAVKTFNHILQQLRKHGVSDSEFMDAKKRRVDELEGTTSYESRYWLDEIDNNLVHKEALPNDKRGYMKNWILNYEACEFNEFIKEINLDMPEDIGILAPANHPAIGYTEEEIRSWISEVGEESFSPYVLPEAPTNVMTSSETEKLQKVNYQDMGIGESGAHEILLENGVKVILKPYNPTQNDSRKRIALHGFKNKGALEYDAEEYYSAINAPLFIRNSGIRKFNKFDLQRYVSNSSFRVPSLYINNYESGVKVRADLSDVENMLQLVFLFFTEPSADTLAFQDWKAERILYYQNQQIDYSYIDLSNNIKKIIGDNSEISSGTERYHGLEETDMKKGLEIYNEIFGNARDFSFIITGDFAADSIIPTINKYLGNLPSYHPDTVNTQNTNSFSSKPTGPILVQFRAPEASNRSNYIYNPSYIVPSKGREDWKEKIITEALGHVLHTKVRGLRFEKGYSLYSMGAAAKYNNSMGQYEFSAIVRCTPEEYPLLRDEFENIIAELKTELISNEFFEQALMDMRSTYNPSSIGNSRYRINQKLYEHYRYGMPWVEREKILTYIDEITPKDILNAANKFFIAENFYEFVTIN